MAFDAFMFFPGQSRVQGETNDEVMAAKKAFEIKSFSFGASNNISIGSHTGGGGAGKASFKDFKVVKRTDTASCGLFATLCNGTHFDEAIIELRRSGGSASASGATFMKFHFKLVMVKDLEWEGTDGEDTCEETILFNYGAIKVEYFKQDKTGKLTKASGDQGEAKFSQVKNKADYIV